MSNEYIATVIEFEAASERYYNAYNRCVQENTKNDPAAFLVLCKMV